MSNVDQRVIYRANKKKSRGIIPRSKFLNLAKKKKKKGRSEYLKTLREEHASIITHNYCNGHQTGEFIYYPLNYLHLLCFPSSTTTTILTPIYALSFHIFITLFTWSFLF